MMTAELRVYQPLMAFDDSMHAELQTARKRFKGTQRAREAAAQARILSRDPFPNEEPDDYIRVLTEHLPTDTNPFAVSDFYCPDDLRARCELAAFELSHELPEDVFDALIPAEARERNRRRLQADLMELDDPPATLLQHIQTSPWTVPATWFFLFGPDTFHYASIYNPDSGEYTRSDIPETLGDRDTVQLVIPVEMALEHGRRAARLLMRYVKDWEVSDQLVTTIDWLQKFHEDSMLELDYGGLTPYIWPNDTPYYAHTGINCLEAGDIQGAVIAHHQMMRTWAPQAQRPHLN